jgi:DNA-binding beta-propeller fold protein YncE
MKKTILISTIATLIIFFFTSCSSQEDNITSNKDSMKHLLCLELTLTSPSKIVIAKISLEDGSKEIIREIKNGIPDGIWVDEKNERIYWTVMGQITDPPEGFSAKDGSIESCNMSGGDYKVLIGNGQITTPKQIIGKTDLNRIYWSDREGMSVMSSDLQGSDLQIHVQNNVDQNVSKEEQYCVGVALDSKNEYLYWTQKGPADGGKGKIFRIKNNLNPTNTPQLLLNGLPEPIDLQFGKKTGKLYWTDRGLAPNGNSLNSAVISPEGQLTQHHIIINGLQEGIGIAIDEDEKFAYVSDLGGNITKVNLMNESSEILLKQGPTTGIVLTK